MRNVTNDTVRVTATPAPRAGGSSAAATSFAGVLDRPTQPTSPAARAIADAAQREVQTIQSQEQTLDRLIAGNNTGSLDNGDLLRLQATMYSYSQRVDVATRIVDRAASGLRQLLTIQV